MKLYRNKCHTSKKKKFEIEIRLIQYTKAL